MAQKQFVSPEIDQKIVQSVAAVLEPTRLRILFLLGEQGRLCVGDIASHFRITRPAVSHHLKILKDNSVVLGEKVGQEVYYTVDAGRLVVMLRYMADTLEQCCPAGKPDNHESPQK